MRTLLLLLLALVSLGVLAALPPPGSPERLTDWRWLARSPEGRQRVLSSKDKLEAYAGKFLLLEVTGPGVLDHLILRDANLTVSITADDRPLWQGKMSALATPPANSAPLFPLPVFFAAPSFYHLLAPIGFKASLRILVDKVDPWRYLSYRTFRDAAAIFPASADANGAYAQGLQAAAVAWKAPLDLFNAQGDATRREVSANVVIPAAGRATAVNLTGSGEITRLEFHLIPALVGSLRELVVEFYYDGAKEPALRLPVTDLVGMPHPWTQGRWDQFSGTLAAGIRYPWQEYTPRIMHHDAHFYFNLPIPYANGLRIELVNRSERMMFSGTVRALVAQADDAKAAGRLCGTRLIAPVTTAAALMTLPGPGQLAALSLFCTGNGMYPPAQLNGAAWLMLDGAPTVAGPGLAPLWLAGGYGGPYTGLPNWNHPRMEPGYIGVTRYFTTDPLYFDKDAAFGYHPGNDLTGAPTSATVIALWYHYGAAPYAAPALPAHAEALPYTTISKASWHVPAKGAQLAATIEAEDLAPMAIAHGGEARVVEDTEHNYHASNGRYLAIRVDNIGDYVDLQLPFPASRYFVIGQANMTVMIEGMSHTCFELALLSRDEARQPPPEVSAKDRFAWSVLGGAQMNLQIFVLGGPSYRRDPINYYAPQLNPAPDGDGVFRFICRGPGVRMLSFDNFWLYMPPPTADGWYEFEENALPDITGDLTAMLPLTGRVEWSGWGAVKLSAKESGRATLRTLVLAGPAAPKELKLTGSLPPGSGNWQAAVAGSTAPAVTLTPGKDANQVVEWTLPVAGPTLPGPLTLEITYTPPAAMDKTPTGQLFLDAWAVR
ncbi:MAG: DUF2961 domain-containing protein [Armatimonadota bacterium]